MKTKHIIMGVTVLLVLVVIGWGVSLGIRPYKTPIIEEIEPFQTAFVIDLTGGTEDQAKFSSIDFLEQAKVAAKEIELPQRWVQTGKLPTVGAWRPTQKVIRVDRTDVSRLWTKETSTGTSAKSQVLEAESQDSVGVGIGFTLTASILEEDAAKYLYYYPNRALTQVVDGQIFNSAQAVFSEVCGKYPVKSLPNYKDEITGTMREDLIPLFKKKGITIDPTMGIHGGLLYDNPAIQDAIDAVFIAQTLEAKKEAERIAQIKLDEMSLQMAQNAAEMRKVTTDAEAYEITKKAEAIAEGGEAYKTVRTLEVLASAIEKWNGNVPVTFAGTMPFQHMTLPTATGQQQPATSSQVVPLASTGQ